MFMTFWLLVNVGFSKVAMVVAMDTVFAETM